METKNVCPYCGSSDIRANIESGDSCDEFAFCGKCGMRGPAVIDGFDEAIAAFCHPAHLMEGKVMVSKDDLESLLTMHDCGACCGNIDEITNRLKAAIDAAGGGK